MNQYEILELLGRGTYGDVYRCEFLFTLICLLTESRAKVKRTGDLVAIKKLKEVYKNAKQCLNLPEVKALCKCNHPNIVRLKEVIHSKGTLYLIFENMDTSLHDYLKTLPHGRLPEVQVKNFMFQILQALDYLHTRRQFVHRDIKPENLLLKGETTIKLADFGLARDLSETHPLSMYVSTRWYRAPEIILQMLDYGPAVDIWAVGCLIVELLTSEPIFPGQSEIDMLFYFFGVLGPLTAEEWPEGHRKCTSMFEIPKPPRRRSVQSILGEFSLEVAQLVEDMLKWNPAHRPSAREALQYPFFHMLTGISSELGSGMSLRKKRTYAAITEPEDLSSIQGRDSDEKARLDVSFDPCEEAGYEADTSPLTKRRLACSS